MIFNYCREEGKWGVPVVQLSLPSPLRNICPSNVAAAPLSPREVACPAQDGQVCASVIKRPSCAVTSGTEAGVIHDPVSAPSEGQTQTLTGQLRVKPRMEYLWRTTTPSPPRTLVGATSARSPTLLPKCRMGPHQPCQSIKREHHICPPAVSCVPFLRRVIQKDGGLVHRRWGNKYIYLQLTYYFYSSLKNTFCDCKF